jgi:hypothetical protein
MNKILEDATPAGNWENKYQNMINKYFEIIDVNNPFPWNMVLEKKKG